LWNFREDLRFFQGIGEESKMFSDLNCSSMLLALPSNLPSQSKLDSVGIDAKRCAHQVTTKTCCAGQARQTQFVQVDVAAVPGRAFYLR
jgi:hypothetical protein